ncbi:MAG TPA: PilN domain-containing protein, partial [Aquabacterium sp.]|nr:PilN domain-containing protein [Aquabacterium sp.]
MILINLLPHREEKRKLRKQAFFVGLGLSVVAGAVIVALWYAVQLRMMATQQTRNEILTSAIHKLDDEIKDVSALKAEIDSLKARQRAVEDLQTDRNMPVYLLNELVAQTPEGIYLTSIHQKGQSVTVAGMAQTNERVSEFLRNTNSRSKWLEHPEL